MMNFIYKEHIAFDHMLVLKSDDGLEIEIGFDGLDAEFIYISGYEMAVNSDDYKGLYAQVNGHAMPIFEIVRESEKAIGGVSEEIEAENLAEKAMADELSSPYLTGRI